jgi:RNA polymerase sigma-70 factor, ECF subfamily
MDNYDERLIEQVLEGDIDAFRVLVDRHKAKVFFLGLKFFHNNEDAEDFAQDVFLRAYKKLYMYRREVPFGAWLYRLSFNCAINKYKFDKNRLTDIEEPDLAFVTTYEQYSDPEKRAFYRDLKEKVNRILATLPEAYVIVIRMHFFDRLSYREISEITDIPVNTIKSHILRAKLIIKKALEPFA